MEQRLYVSEYLSQDDISKELKGKLFNYNDYNHLANKDALNIFYYNEEEKNKFLENYKNSVKEKNKNKYKMFKNGKEASNINQNLQTKKSLFNFKMTEDKNKNLKVNKKNEDNANMNLYLRLYKKKNQNNIKKGLDNLIKKKNSKENVFATFNAKYLANINTNVIKLISQQIMEMPISQVCYFTREFRKGEELLYSKPIILPKNELCYFKKSFIYNDKKVLLPKTEICYYNRLYITFEQKYKNTVLSRRYFCTKIKKKNKAKKLSAKGDKYLKNNKNLGNNKKSKNNNIVNDKRKSPKKENIKYKSHNDHFFKKENNKLNNFETLNHNNNYYESKQKNSSLPKNIYLKQNKIKPKTKSKSPKHKKNKNNFLPNIIKDQPDVTSTSSSFERGRQHSSLFQHLLNKKEIGSEIIGIKQNKVLLKKHMPNGYELSRNYNGLYMPKIKDTNTISISYKTPKTKPKISPNIKSSRDLIKKINEEVVLNDRISKINNNGLFSSYETPSYHIMNYHHKDVENNFIKCDIHYNTNNSFCPKCQQIQLRNHSLQESVTQKTPNNYKKLLKLNFNNIRNNLVLTPLQMKNNNNRYENGSIFENFKRNKKSITLKKINYSKGTDEMIKKYKSGYFAIKEYFNIK